MTRATRSKPDAWGDFWSDSARAGGGGCLPNAYRTIFDMQAQAWSRFAKELPAKARILDLATGDGQVMAWLLDARPDLRIIGCDLSATLPTPPKGTKVRAGIAMEDLPYRADAFDAVTSQFGFEYGETAKVSAQVARVLKPTGTLAILTHRKDGPILVYNLARRDQLLWALEERKIVTIARRSLALRGAGIAALPPAIMRAVEDGNTQYGAGSVAWEIAEAVRQTLMLGQRDSAANVAGVLDRIAAKARNELGRIASLQGACETTQNAAAFDAALTRSELRQLSCEPLTVQGEAVAFADFRLIAHD